MTQALDHTVANRTNAVPIDKSLIATLETIDARLRWLSSWTIHNANHLRDSRDGLKVGGHQASCASISAIMTALYFHALGPNDKVAVKPHAGPVLHAIHYLLGNQQREQLENFRGLGGAQSYPSRTKDVIPVDFSTGSVGLGVAITAFASLVQDYLIAHGELAQADTGRMIALMGDAELDEGNIYEALIEGYKHDLRNCWWVVDYNRQSLDATTADRMFRRFDDIFETCGWRVLTLKYGKRQLAAFKKPGGRALQEWIDTCPNADFAVLTYQGGAGWRERLTQDIGSKPHVAKLLGGYDDAALADLMTNLGGHCIETLIEAFAAAQDDRCTMFIAYTVKGYGLPFAGHKDNHAGLMNPGQIESLRESMGISPGQEWEPYAGLGDNAAATLAAFVADSPLTRHRQEVMPAPIPIPAKLVCNRRRRHSAMCCWHSPSRERSWPTVLSRPRRTSQFPPTLAHSSIRGDCFVGRNWPMSSAMPRSHRRRNGQATVPANTSSLGLPRTTCSWCWRRWVLPRRCSVRG
jgi:pyruvate dehydrogenase E1 component